MERETINHQSWGNKHGYICPVCGDWIYYRKNHPIIEQEIITQQCECCHEWVNQEELLWDLEEDRMVCRDCHDSNVVDTK